MSRSPWLASMKKGRDGMMADEMEGWGIWREMATRGGVHGRGGRWINMSRANSEGTTRTTKSPDVATSTAATVAAAEQEEQEHLSFVIHLLYLSLCAFISHLSHKVDV